MSSVTGAALGVAADLFAPLTRALGRPPARRASGRAGRTHVEVRGLHRPEHTGPRRLLVKELLTLPGVEGAVVNAVLGRVVVDHAPGVAVADLVAVVAEIERTHDLDAAEAAALSGQHPGDLTPVVRQAVALGVDLVGLGAVLVERTLTPLGPTQIVPPLLTGVLSMADAVPAARAAIERTAGAAATESWFSVGSATVQALGRGPWGLAADVVYRGLRAGEAAARSAAWDAFDRDSPLVEHEAGAQEVPDRPATLTAGAVDHVGDASGAGALAALGVAYALVPERASALLLAGVPKAARWGREAYAAAVHRGLAAAGVVVVDPTAMRRADRVDVVLLAGPLADSGTRAAAAAVGRVVVTDAPDAATVTDLQRGGHGVVVVAADDAAALGAADLSVGVRSGDAPLPWTADLRCADVGQARAALRAVAGARAAGRRAATLALVGSLVGAPVALTSGVTGLTGRANLPVTLAAVAALGINTWTGRAATTG